MDDARSRHSHLPGSAAEKAAWSARNRARWDAAAEQWTAMLDGRADEVREELERVARALPLRAGQHLLDAGCGGGHWTLGFAERGAQVTAVDIAPEMLRITRERIANADEAVRAACSVREGSLLALPLDDASVDVVHCRCVLQFNADPVRALGDIARVVRPGGQVVLCVPGNLSPIYSESWRRFVGPPEAQTNTFLTPRELEGLLTQAGWRVRDGWGVLTRSGTGEANTLANVDLQALPVPLQQAVATSWTLICTPPPREAE